MKEENQIVSAKVSAGNRTYYNCSFPKNLIGLFEPNPIPYLAKFIQ